MKYKYAIIKKGDEDFFLFIPIDSVDMNAIIRKHDPTNRNVIEVQQNQDGKNTYYSLDNRKLIPFKETENFDNLEWKLSSIDLKNYCQLSIASKACGRGHFEICLSSRRPALAGLLRLTAGRRPASSWVTLSHAEEFR